MAIQLNYGKLVEFMDPLFQSLALAEFRVSLGDVQVNVLKTKRVHFLTTQPDITAGRRSCVINLSFECKKNANYFF